MLSWVLIVVVLLGYGIVSLISWSILGYHYGDTASYKPIKDAYDSYPDYLFHGLSQSLRGMEGTITIVGGFVLGWMAITILIVGFFALVIFKLLSYPLAIIPNTLEKMGDLFDAEH